MAKWELWKNIMKCVPFEPKRLVKWQPPYIVQPKYDGFRCRKIDLENGEVLLLTSSENIFYSVPHLNEMFKTLNIPGELDGELYCHGMNFNQISSILSRTTNLHPDHKEIQFHCFDIVNDCPQMERTLQISKLKNLHPNLQISPFWICYTLDDIMRVYDKLLSLNYEGIIVRRYIAPYERKRSTSIMKFKPKKEDDYIVVSTVEEFSVEGSPKNCLGSLICQSGDGNLFGIGTGFTREDRENLWKIKDRLPGMVAKVQYQHLSSGKHIPRFPVFVSLHENEEQKEN